MASLVNDGAAITNVANESKKGNTEAHKKVLENNGVSSGVTPIAHNILGIKAIITGFINDCGHVKLVDTFHGIHCAAEMMPLPNHEGDG